MSDTPPEDRLVAHIRGAWAPERVDPDAFAASLRSRVRRRLALCVAAIAAPAVLFAVWPADEPAPIEVPAVALVTDPVPAVPPALLDISGIATTADGAPLAGAQVVAGDRSATTDERGRFSIRASVGESLRIEKAGWSTAWARVHGDEPVTVAALPVGAQGTLPGAEGGTLTGHDGFTLKLPPHGVRDASGALFAGEVHVRWTLLRRPQDMVAAPGDLATVVDGAEVPLESFGMVEVVLSDPEGAELELTASAEIGVPLADGHPFAEGQSVGLYAFDEGAGIWNDEGQGIVRDGRMVATVGHFSWWNCDEPLANTGCVCGKVALKDRKIPLRLRAIGEKYLTSIGVMADKEDGSYCVDSKPSSPLRVHVLQHWGNECLRGSSGSVVASRPGTSSVVDTRQCARAPDFEAQIEACPAGAVATNAPPVRAPGRPSEGTATLQIVGGGTVETMVIGAPPEEDLLHITVWSASEEVPAEQIGVRCGDLEWEKAIWRPVIAGGTTVPVIPGETCEVRVKDEVFLVAPIVGLTEVFCNRKNGDPCRVGSPIETPP